MTQHEVQATDSVRRGHECAPYLYDPARYIRLAPALRSALTALAPNREVDLLSYLLCIGRDSFEFDPIDQARIGGSPAWIQGPEFPTCSACKKRLRFIAQFPGSAVSAREHQSGTFYVFGCTTHPSDTRTVYQTT